MRSLLLLALAVMLWACEDREDVYVLNPDNIAGVIRSDVNLDASVTYHLDGALVVENGGVLRIPAGTQIIAKGNTTSYVAIARGGKIFASGSADSPIVFTSDIKKPGSWGGLVICGRAPTNFSFGASGVANAEIGDLLYGGTDDDDNSGIITYVRVEYSGYSYDGDRQFNGFSFFGVCSETTVHHISSYESADDGIEFFGGYFNADYVVAINSHDDGIDFTDGWQGSGQFWYSYNSDGSGVEGSNNDSGGSNTSPLTTANLKNITVYKSKEYPWFLKSGAGAQHVENLLIGGLPDQANLPYIHFIYPTGSTGDQATLDRITAGDISFTDVRVVDMGEGNRLIDDNNPLQIIINEGVVGAGQWTDDSTFEPTWVSGWAKPE